MAAARPEQTQPALGRDLLVAVVTVPKIDDTFAEMETVVQTDEEVPTAPGAAHAVLAGRGTDEADLTNGFYTDAVDAAGPA